MWDKSEQTVSPMAITSQRDKFAGIGIILCRPEFLIDFIEFLPYGVVHELHHLGSKGLGHKRWNHETPKDAKEIEINVAGGHSGVDTFWNCERSEQVGEQGEWA